MAILSITISGILKKLFNGESLVIFFKEIKILKNGKLNEAIYFYQSGKKTSQVPDKLIKYFPEFDENKTLLV